MNMSLDDLKGLGIVVGRIVDAELGNKFIACVGKVTPGGVRSDDGQYGLRDSDFEAAMHCYVGSPRFLR
jgi:hypothetical protein